MDDSRRAPAPLLVERFLSDTLSEGERAVFMSATSERERAQLRAEHEALQASLLSRSPPAAFARLVRARAEREHAHAPRARVARVLAFACLIASVVFVASDALPGLDPPREREQGGRLLAGEESERAKGLAPSLRVYRKGAAGPELLAHGQRVEAGDVLQLGYLVPGMNYAVLLSIDGRARVTLHFPENKDGSTRLSAVQGEQLLPAAYELDDAPEYERFVLITARRPLRVPELLRAAGELSRRREGAREKPLALPAYAEQVSVLLEKGGP
jgi:hypothetical protein